MNGWMNDKTNEWPVGWLLEPIATNGFGCCEVTRNWNLTVKTKVEDLECSTRESMCHNSWVHVTITILVGIHDITIVIIFKIIKILIIWIFIIVFYCMHFAFVSICTSVKSHSEKLMTLYKKKETKGGKSLQMNDFFYSSQVGQEVYGDSPVLSWCMLYKERRSFHRYWFRSAVKEERIVWKYQNGTSRNHPANEIWSYLVSICFTCRWILATQANRKFIHWYGKNI